MKQQLVPDPFGAGLSSAPIPAPTPISQWLAQRQAQPYIQQRAMRQQLMSGQVPSMSDIYAGMPIGVAQGAWDMFTLPGDAMAGRVSGDPNDPAFMDRVGNAALSLTGGAGVVPAAGAELGMGIRAYHGSPHNFDQFSMGKLGTGEGSQVYGHGLYFAENPKVAEHYRDALSRSELRHPDFGAVEPGEMNLMIADAAQQAAPSLNPAIHEQITARVSDILAGYSTESLDDVRQAVLRYGGGAPQEQAAWLGALNRAQEFQTGPAGKVYEVDIDADPAKLLDFDRSLVDQSQPVQQAVGKLVPAYEPYTRPPESFKSAGQYMDATGGLPPPSGANAYYSLAQSQAPGKAGEVAASNTLRESGIPGIRFLDQGSRGTGAGTRNLVVFDDQIIKILRKYGIAGLAVLPPATAAAVRQYMEPVEHDPFAQ